MKKGTVIIIAVVVVILLLVGIPVGQYNALVSAQTGVENELANIDTQLQRRMDLIPNLVETVKGFTTHETEVFTAVNESREKLMGAGTMEEKAAANDEMTNALNQLIAVAEAYPDLKSDTVYVGLMDELAGTENRIAVARTNYNEAVTNYNLKIRKFPGNIFAGMFGFEKAELFQVAEGATPVPEVNFN